MTANYDPASVHTTTHRVWNLLEHSVAYLMNTLSGYSPDHHVWKPAVAQTHRAIVTMVFFCWVASILHRHGTRQHARPSPNPCSVYETTTGIGCFPTHTEPIAGKDGLGTTSLHGVPYLSRDTIAGDMPKLKKQSLEMARAAPLRHEAFHT